MIWIVANGLIWFAKLVPIMGDGVSVKVDLRSALAGLHGLAGPVRESLGRRMIVAAGQEMRDEAKRWVPTSSGPYNAKSRGSHQATTLRNAIYLARDKRNSTDTSYVYNVSWSNTDAWWGKLIEFGYTQKYVTIFNKKIGAWQSLAKGTHGRLLAKPRRFPAKPFLRPAYSIVGPKVLAITCATARVELPILLRENQK